MGQLFFKKQFQDAIRDGSKRTTIRRWTRPMVHVGSEAFSPGLGWLAIKSVESVDIDLLDDADAKADGFTNRSAMRKTLVELYPNHAADGKQWFRVAFTLSKQIVRKSKKPTHPQLF